MPSKLEQLQQQYRRQLLQEKEERMIKIHTESQQKALSKVARYNGVTTTSTITPQHPASHHSPVKKGSPGVDRSRPLPPISKDRYTNTRASPVSAPTDNASKVPSVNSRSKSVDLVDSRQSPPRGVPNVRNGYTNVTETSYEFQSTRYEETRFTSSQLETKSAVKTRPVIPKDPVEVVDAQGRKPDSETMAKLRQAELQRLRSKSRDESAPRQNGLSSDNVAKSSNITTGTATSSNHSSTVTQKKTPAKTPTTTPARSKPSFLNPTAASSRKVTATTTNTPTPVSKAPSQQQRGKAPAAKSTVGSKPPGPGQEQCHVCGRNFNADRIEKHVSVCQKASQKKVKVFDATKMRVKGTEAESFVKKGVPKNEPKKKQSDWRKKRNEFIEAIRQAKLVQQHLANGGKISDLPPPKPSDNSDYVQCPYCNRKFNEAVAERHIPKCKNILSNKKNPVPRKK